MSKIQKKKLSFSCNWHKSHTTGHLCTRLDVVFKTLNIKTYIVTMYVFFCLYILLFVLLVPVRPCYQLQTKLLLLPVKSMPSACLHTSQTFCVFQDDSLISLVSRLDPLYCFCDLCSGIALCSFEIRDLSQIS